MANYESYIETVEDFPVPGISFYDISPLLGDGPAFAGAIKDMAEPLADNPDLKKIACFDARGFIFGSAMAVELGVGCVMLRKPGKLPGEVFEIEYGLEYGTNVLQVQKNAICEGDGIVLVDDVIATGGTAVAGIELVRQCGGTVIEFCSLLDLPALGGSDSIQATGVAVRPLITFSEELNNA